MAYRATGAVSSSRLVLGVLLKLVVIGVLINQLALYVPLPIVAYRVLLPIWRRFGYGPGASLASRRIAADAARRGHPGTAIEVLRRLVSRGVRKPTAGLALDLLALAEAPRARLA